MFDPISIGATLLGGLLGGSGGGGSGDQRVTQVPWEGIQPYLTKDSGYVPQTSNPVSSDWLWWNYMMQQGYPVGPPPPMFVDDPRYTGENVYDPPSQYQQARTAGPGYGDQGPYGAPVIDTGGLLNQPGGIGDYPSGTGNTRPPTAPPPANPPVNTGPSDADLARAQEFMRLRNLSNSMYDGNYDQVNSLDALRWAQAHPDANAALSAFDGTGLTQRQLLALGALG